MYFFSELSIFSPMPQLQISFAHYFENILNLKNRADIGLSVAWVFFVSTNDKIDK